MVDVGTFSVGTFSIFSFISIEGIWVGFGSVGGGGTEEGTEVGRDEVETCTFGVELNEGLISPNEDGLKSLT